MAQNQIRRVPYCKTHPDQQVYLKEHGGFLSKRQEDYFCSRCNRFLESQEIQYLLFLHCDHCGKDYEALETEPRVECPNCHSQWQTKAPHVCCHLAQPTVREPEDILIWSSGVTLFSPDATIAAPAGTDAVAVQGTDCWAVTSANPQPFREAARGASVQADIYYVRQQINHVFPVGTHNPFYVFSADHSQRAEVRCALDLRVRVKDSLHFLREMNYGRRTLKDLREGTETFQGLDTRLFEHIGEHASEAFQRLIDESGVDPLQLQYQLPKAQKALSAQLDRYLEAIGLRVDSIVFQSFSIQPTTMTDTLLFRVERRVKWSPKAIRVYEKDHKEYDAWVKLGGAGQIRLRNRATLLSTAEGQRWNDPKTPFDLAADTISEEIGQLVYAVFTELLQNMINQTGTDLDSIPSFLSFLQNTIESFLNSQGGILESRGLSIGNVSMSVEQMQKSEALAKRESVDSRILSTEEEERLRKYADGIRLTQAKDASGFRIEEAKIHADETEQIFTQEQRENEIARKKEEAKRTAEEWRLDANAAAISHQQNLAAQLQAEQIRQKHDLETLQQTYDDQGEDSKRRRNMEIELEGYQHAYTVWQAKHRLEEEQRLAREREIEDKLDAELRSRQKVSGASRAELLSDAGLKQALAEIMRSIQESDLSLQQKLDSYAHLREMTELRDQFDLSEQKERLEISLSQLRARNSLELTRENAELADELEERLQNRRERALQADFLRDMEEKRVRLAHEIQLLQLEQEKEKLQAEAESRREAQRQDLERLTLTLSHLEKLNESTAARDIAAIRAKVDEAHEICEALKVSTSLAKEEEKERRAEESRNQEREADRVERLYKEVLELERQRLEMQASAPLVFELVREEEPKEKPSREKERQGLTDAQIERLFNYVRSLKNDVSQIRKETQNPKPQETRIIHEVREPQWGNGYSPASGNVKYCPRCRKSYPIYVTYCPDCSARL